MSTGESLVYSKMIYQASSENYIREISSFKKLDVERDMKHEMEDANTALSCQEIRGTDEISGALLYIHTGFQLSIQQTVIFSLKNETSSQDVFGVVVHGIHCSYGQ